MIPGIGWEKDAYNAGHFRSIERKKIYKTVDGNRNETSKIKSFIFSQVSDRCKNRVKTYLVPQFHRSSGVCVYFSMSSIFCCSLLCC